MAKQVGPLFFTGTIDGLIFYKVGEQYYTRSKGSYKSAKYMRRTPKYKRTMQNADQFGEASKLVGEVYYQYLPKSVRKRGLYGELTGIVKRWLQEGKTKDEAQALLIAHCLTLSIPTEQLTTDNKQRSVTTQQPATQPRSTITELCATNLQKAEQRTMINEQRPKQARYLSHWKVKQNGQLQISNVKEPLFKTEFIPEGNTKKSSAFDSSS